MKRCCALFVLCLLCATVARSGHILIDGSYTSPDDGIYPGTTRAYQIYVPDQYDGRSAACLYVGLDGILCNAPAVMDSLIARGQMPVTIGVFVQPGVIRHRQGEVLRYNRSTEFDTPDPTFARFLEQQLLPHVLERVAPDGRHLRVSPRGADHMIFGLSSGGIAAFAAAWHRPDLFGRVFSGVGTFVAMRGGNDLQAIVRKHEPRPLRVFLQDGSNDVWNPLFGHWYEGNRMLATALEFAGYDCRFDWSDGGHNTLRSTEIFGQVMQWMWRDWPQPPVVGNTANDLLARLLIAGQHWVSTTARPPTIKAVEAYSPDSSFCVMAERGSNWLQQVVIDPSTGLRCAAQRFYWLHAYDNALLSIGGMAFDADGNLWVVTSAGLQICDQNGRVRAILALPAGLDASEAAICIGDDTVTISDAGSVYTRRLRVSAPTPGQRPATQGQG